MLFPKRVIFGEFIIDAEMRPFFPLNSRSNHHCDQHVSRLASMTAKGRSRTSTAHERGNEDLDKKYVLAHKSPRFDLTSGVQGGCGIVFRSAHFGADKQIV